MDERRQLEMQLPGDRCKEFVVSIDTAHVRSADANSARNFEIVVARCDRGGRGDVGGRHFTTSNTNQHAIRDRALHALRQEGYCGFGDMTVISEGAEIFKRFTSCDAETDHPHHRLVPHRYEDSAHAADRGWGRAGMRYPASERLEIIRLVEQSHLPAKRTLDRLGIPRRTFYRWYDRYPRWRP